MAALAVIFGIPLFIYAVFHIVFVKKDKETLRMVNKIQKMKYVFLLAIGGLFLAISISIPPLMAIFLAISFLYVLGHLKNSRKEYGKGVEKIKKDSEISKAVSGIKKVLLILLGIYIVSLMFVTAGAPFLILFLAVCILYAFKRIWNGGKI
jgi:hypothetical protein